MDKANFRLGGSCDKNEGCDLLTADARMICVEKNLRPPLSHLFSQGSVSATLLRSEESYRENRQVRKCKVAGFPVHR